MVKEDISSSSRYKYRYVIIKKDGKLEKKVLSEDLNLKFLIFWVSTLATKLKSP